MTFRTRRTFSREFKLQVLREVDAGKSAAQVCRTHQIHPNCILKWRKQLAAYGDQAFAGNGNSYTQEAKIAELERLIGQQAIEIDFLKKLHARLDALRNEDK
jgi:transposase